MDEEAAEVAGHRGGVSDPRDGYAILAPRIPAAKASLSPKW